MRKRLFKWVLLVLIVFISFTVAGCTNQKNESDTVKTSAEISADAQSMGETQLPESQFGQFSIIPYELEED